MMWTKTEFYKSTKAIQLTSVVFPINGTEMVGYPYAKEGNLIHGF